MKPRLRLDGFFDIECANWDRFVCGAIYRPIDGVKIVRTLDDLVDELLRRGGMYWTWNGGKYDTLAVAEKLRERGINATCRMSGSSVSRLVAGHLQILDAHALIPMPLDEATGLIGRAAAKLPWPCRCDDNCGGYCRIDTRLDLAMMADLLGYCSQDAIDGYDVVAAVLTRFASVGMELRGTLGGTAWETARRWADLPVAKWRSELWRFAREGYFGGRVIVARPKATAGTHHDLSAAYPAALAATSVPVGDPVEAAGRRARLAFDRGIPGIYRARVIVPDGMWIPPLPMRLADDSITYATGKLRGTWTQPELAGAIERGVKLHAIDECLAWPDGAQRILSGPVKRWYGYRIEAGKDTAWGKLWRLIANSVTGKLAEQPERGSIVINPSTIKYCDGVCERSRRFGCTRGYCTERCGSYKQLDPDGRVFNVPYYRIGESAHIHWAAYLTATTRMEVGSMIDVVGHDLVYSDTDSIWTVGRRPFPEGDDMGHWAFKHAWTDFSCLAPKVYRYVDPSTGEVVCRVAGAPRVDDARWVAGQSYDARGVYTLREAAATGDLFQRRDHERKLPEPHGWYGDRRLETSEGVTYPAPYGEAEKEKRRARNGAG
jgi:hypothetical protein